MSKFNLPEIKTILYKSAPRVLYCYSVIELSDIEGKSFDEIEPKFNTKQLFSSPEEAIEDIINNTDWFWAYIYSFDGNNFTYLYTMDDDGNVYNQDERMKQFSPELLAEMEKYEAEIMRRRNEEYTEEEDNRDTTSAQD